jgi:hypothetical protein
VGLLNNITPTISASELSKKIYTERMVALGNEMSEQLWSPFDYNVENWVDAGTLYANTNLYEERDLHEYAAGLQLEPHKLPYSIKRCQGFVRCDMDIDAEVVGWVIGKNGGAIKDLKNKTGCNMWVDQRALTLTITGPDPHIVEHAARSVQAYVAAAPIKASAVEASITRSMECPPHYLDVLGDRATIARIVKETRAQVVVNKKMARVIIRGRPHPVEMACIKVQQILSIASAEYMSRESNNHVEKNLPHIDYEMNSLFSSTNLVRSPTDSCSIDSPSGNNGNRSWSLFSGPAVFDTSNVAPISSNPRSVLNNSSKTKFFASSLEEDSTSIASTSTSSSVNRKKIGTSGLSSSVDVSTDNDTDDLHSLLGKLKLEKYASTFTENEVDMDAVRLMNESDFTDLGIPKGPRLKILNAIWATTPQSN